MRGWLPWIVALAAMLALVAVTAASLWRPDSVAWRLGFGEMVGERHHQQWRAAMRGQLNRLDAGTPAGAVLFLGDSYVQGLNTSRVAACTANFGIGGETAQQLPDRIGDLRSLGRAGAVVAMTGLNDVVQGRDAGLADSYRRLLAALPADRPVLLSSLPRLVPGSAHAFAAVRGSSAARAACAAHANCRFVDLAAAMDEPTAFLESDGKHLNPAGYALWARLLRDTLDAAGVPDAGCIG